MTRPEAVGSHAPLAGARVAVQHLLLSRLAPGIPFYARENTLADLPPFDRNFVEIMAISSGRGTLVSRLRDGRILARPLRAGDVIFFRPFDVTAFRRTDPRGVTTYGVSLAEADWSAFASLAAIDRTHWNDPDEPPIARGDLGLIDDAYLRAMERYHARPEPLDLVRFLTAVAPVLFPRRDSPNGAGAPGWLATGLAEMRREDNLRAGLPRLRELAHVTAPHLSSTARRYFGKTPSTLVRDLRLNHAAMLLCTTPTSVAAIAARCGFDNVPYFATCFRRLYGVSPREYRLRSIAAILLGEDAAHAHTPEPERGRSPR